MNADLPTILRTVRHLRPGQIGSRLSMLVRRQLLLSSPLSRSGLRSQVQDHDLLLPLPLPAVDAEPSTEIFDGRVVTLLGQSVDLGSPIDWEPKGVDKQWHYRLHSFGFVHSLGSCFRDRSSKHYYHLFRELVEEWVGSCAIATVPAWDPYPVSLRIRNWLHALGLFAPALEGDVPFRNQLIDSLYVQAAYLERFVESHLLGNHLIENGRALLLAGLFFEEGRARRWRRKGEKILWRELERQVLADGGHDERSPMYHQLMLDVYRESVEILESAGASVPEGVREKLDDMARWLAAVHHPDGRIALLNDSVYSAAGSAVPLIGGVEPPGDGLTALDESGYFVFRSHSQGDCLVLDCGPLGPDHQPGHGHCDCLSFELSLAGQRMIVDSGVGTYYGEPSWRHYYRSTRAHNTVQVDGEEQSEIWDRFRAARRARPSGVRWDRSDGVDWVTGAHTGYRRLPGRVEHRRWVLWIDRRYWLICDRITGDGSHSLRSFLHFHPEAKVSVPSDNGGLVEGVVRRRGASCRVLVWGGAEVKQLRGETDELQGWYASDFNQHVANSVWAICTESALPAWLAYVLVPGHGPAAAHLSSVGGGALQAELTFESARFRVTCDKESVEVERR